MIILWVRVNKLGEDFKVIEGAKRALKLECLSLYIKKK